MSKIDRFIVFHHSDDGETDCYLMTEQEILDLLKEDEDEDYSTEFLEKLPELGWDYGGDCYLVIKGEIIVPKSVEKIIKWEL